MSGYDPHSDYGPAWADPIGRLRAAESEVRSLRAQLAEVTAERDAMLTGVCRALLRDAMFGRVGVGSVVRGVLG